MKLSDQEIYLVKKLSELYDLENYIRKTLASIRGGQRIHITEDIRPDEDLLKNA
jgi:hypothetical protein